MAEYFTTKEQTIIGMFGNLSSSRQDLLLQELANSMPYPESTVVVVDTVIENINNNQKLRVDRLNATIYEASLRFIVSKGRNGTKLSEFREFMRTISDSDNIDIAASKTLGRLDEKLRDTGYTLSKKDSTFTILPLPDDTVDSK